MLARRPRGRSLQGRLPRQQDLGLLLHHGVQSARQPVQFRTDRRRSGRTQALLSQNASLDPCRAVGAGRHWRSRLRRAERLEDRAHHLPRRHVPRDGARMRLQGRRDHDPHRRLHRADPRLLALHQPGQCVPEPDGHRQRLHVRLRRLVRLDGRGHDRQFRRFGDRARNDRTRRRDHHRRGPPRSGARGAQTSGRSRTTSTSSAIAATSP